MASLLTSKHIPELTTIASQTIATTLLSSNNPSFQHSVYQLPSHLLKPVLSAASKVYHVSKRCYGSASHHEEYEPATDSSRIFLTFEEADAYALKICKMQAQFSTNEERVKHPVFHDCVGYVCRGEMQHNMFYVQACELETEPGIPLSLTDQDEIVCVLLTNKDLRPFGHNMNPSWDMTIRMQNRHAHMYNKVFAGKTRYARAWLYAEQMASDTSTVDILQRRNSDNDTYAAKRVLPLWKNIEIEYTVTDEDTKVKGSKEPSKKKQKKTSSTTSSSTSSSSSSSSTLRRRYIMFDDNDKFSDLDSTCVSNARSRLFALSSKTCLAVQPCTRGSDETIVNQWNTFDMYGILMHTQKEVELNHVKWMEYEEKEKREKKEQEEKRLREQPEREERERRFAEMWATIKTFNK